MAFEISDLTDEEKDYIKNLNIKNYWNDYFTCNPSSAVVDRERKIYFFSEGYDHFGDWDDEAFVLVWKNFCVVSVIRKKFIDDFTVLWSFIIIHIPKEIESCYKEIIQDSKNALLIYEVDGFGEPYNLYGDIKIKFNL